MPTNARLNDLLRQYFTTGEFYSLLAVFLVYPVLLLIGTILSLTNHMNIDEVANASIFLGALVVMAIGVFMSATKGVRDKLNVLWVLGSSLLHLFSIL